jgi:hypothetical protein
MEMERQELVTKPAAQKSGLQGVTLDARRIEPLGRTYVVRGRFDGTIST